MDMTVKFLDLPTDIINDILVICDYKSILRLNCTCKLINNIDLKTLLINKSKKFGIKNTEHFIPRSIIYSEKSKLTYDDTIISCLNYLFSNNIELGYNDRILPDNRKESGCMGAIGFSGCKGKITFRGIIIKPTYKIFEKFLSFRYNNFSVYISKK